MYVLHIHLSVLIAVCHVYAMHKQVMSTSHKALIKTKPICALIPFCNSKQVKRGVGHKTQFEVRCEVKHKASVYLLPV